MNIAREVHTASVLINGKVLVSGGWNGVAVYSAELYDAFTGTWTITGNMNYARDYHTASVLPNGKMLVTGGWNGASYLKSTELYDSSTGTWTIAVNMIYVRGYHTASVLSNGKSVSYWWIRWWLHKQCRVV